MRAIPKHACVALNGVFLDSRRLTCGQPFNELEVVLMGRVGAGSRSVVVPRWLRCRLNIASCSPKNRLTSSCGSFISSVIQLFLDCGKAQKKAPSRLGMVLFYIRYMLFDRGVAAMFALLFQFQGGVANVLCH